MLSYSVADAVQIDIDVPRPCEQHIVNMFGVPSNHDASSPEERWSVVGRIMQEQTARRYSEILAGEFGEAWSRSEDSRDYLSLRTGSVLSVDRTERRIWVHAPDDRHLFVDSYRAARQVLVWRMIAAGSVILHASAVLKDSGIVAFVGHKGAGKTTSMVSALLEDATGFVANDRLLVLADPNGRLHAVGWPMAAYVGLGTIATTVGIEALLGLHESVDGTAYLVLDHPTLHTGLVEQLKNAPLKTIAKHKVFLLPGEVARITGKPVTTGGGLEELRFPEIFGDSAATPSERGNEAVHHAETRIRSEIMAVPDDYPDYLGLAPSYDVETRDRTLSVIFDHACDRSKATFA